MSREKIDFEVVREIARKLPDVEESSLHGAPSIKVAGRLLTCPALHKSAEPNSLAAEPKFYYLTEHYVNHPTVLVRLDEIDRRSLKDLLGMAWRFVSSGPKFSKRKSRSGRCQPTRLSN